MNLSERINLLQAAELHGRLRYGTAIGIGYSREAAATEGVTRARGYLLEEGVDISLFEEDLRQLKAAFLK
ncbi:hypothetical protein MF271_19425 (plasmid) [Deinococcus sp. KNUC1210]|uniref:hypothetical protein n=1 Tax=Deinococcus sp. KNUC1210 TaxID=2917691 RepID=UPI001EEFC9AE|nr:hypothetical protein [Deinococcus sp. KNUC1210]ULH17363.1 hypothetical protein MF271_19425 [Deinococcus sp. KNUC1210]